MTTSGWSSAEVMMQAITQTSMARRNRVEYVMSLEPLRVMAARLKTAIGAVVNVDNVHWVALRWDGCRVWLLDSQEAAPQPLKWLQYVHFIHRHQAAFCIDVAPPIG
jgi:hypothetical protein